MYAIVVELCYLARISRSEVSVVETFSWSPIVDHTESWFHAARVIVTLFTGKTCEWCSRADTIRTPVAFSACYIISARQSVVVCPGLLVGTVTILLNSNISWCKVSFWEQHITHSLMLSSAIAFPPTVVYSFAQCYERFPYFSWLLRYPAFLLSCLPPLSQFSP